MSLLIDFLLNLLSHFPKIISWWLYKPEKTTKNVEVTISATESSIELWCGDRAHFSVWFEVRNNNPFTIEVDRVLVKGNYGSANVVAKEEFGKEVPPKGKIRLHAKGEIPEYQETLIKKSPDDTTITLDFNALIINKYHRIRDYRIYMERLMCKVVNKNINNV